MEDKIIGAYRIRYKGEPHLVPVTESGIIILPDGGRVTLSEERFAAIRGQLSQRTQEQSKSWSLAAPAAAQEEDIGVGSQAEKPSAEPAPSVAEAESAAPEADEKAMSKREKKRSAKAEKPVKEKPVKQSGQSSPVTILVVALASALLTLLVITAAFLYCIGNGIVTVNPRWNGLVIQESQTESVDAEMTSWGNSYIADYL